MRGAALVLVLLSVLIVATARASGGPDPGVARAARRGQAGTHAAVVAQALTCADLQAQFADAVGSSGTLSDLVALAVVEIRTCYQERYRPALVNATTCTDLEAARTAALEFWRQIREVELPGLRDALTGEMAEVDEAVDRVLSLCYAQEIAPPMQAATTCAERKQVIATVPYDVWRHNVAVLGREEQFSKEIAAIDTFEVDSLVVCYNEGYTTCLQQPDAATLTAAVEQMNVALQGLEVKDKLDRVNLEKRENCLTFELTFDSTFVYPHPAIRSRFHVRAVLTVRGLSRTGEGRLVYAEYTVTPNVLGACTVTTTTGDSTLRVLGGKLDFGPDLALDIDPGHPTDSAHLDCPVVGTAPGNFSTLPPDAWSGLWKQLHADEQQDVGYHIQGWSTVTGSPAIVRKTYERNVAPAPGFLPVEETTTLELKHTPVAMSERDAADQPR